MEKVVKELRTAPTFAELFQKVSLVEAGWEASVSATQAAADMICPKRYIQSDERKWGTVAIYLH